MIIIPALRFRERAGHPAGRRWDHRVLPWRGRDWRVHHHRRADVHRRRHSPHCTEASWSAAPAAISATISGRCGSTSLRRAATESLRRAKSLTAGRTFATGCYAVSMWYPWAIHRH